MILFYIDLPSYRPFTSSLHLLPSPLLLIPPLISQSRALIMADQDAKQEPPTWLSYIENSIEEEDDVYGSNAPYYEVIRDLLLDSSAQDEAVEQAIKRCCDQYTGEVDERNARIDEDDPEPPQREEYNYNLLLGTMTALVFEMMGELPYLDTKTNTLSKFLVGLAKHAEDKPRKGVCTRQRSKDTRILTEL